MIGSHGSVCQNPWSKNYSKLLFENVLCPQTTENGTTIKVKYLRSTFLSLDTTWQAIGKVSKFIYQTFVKMRQCYPCNPWDEILFPWKQILRHDTLVDYHLEMVQYVFGTHTCIRNMKWMFVHIIWCPHFLFCIIIKHPLFYIHHTPCWVRKLFFLFQEWIFKI